MIVLLQTPKEPARSFVDRISALQGRDGVVSISITHGFPWGDTPDMGTKVLVYTDGQAAQGQALAQQLAAELWGLREQFQQEFLPVEQALDQALAQHDGLVILADSADNPGGGGSGDSTFLLAALLQRGVANAAIGPLWDPIAVQMAFDAGVGACLGLRIGGKVGPLSGAPLDLQCTVKALVRNLNQTGLGKSVAPMGDCALVQAQGIDIVLSTLRCQTIDQDLFTQLGCDPASKHVLVVKSMQHFYASFAPIAKHIIQVAAPGADSPFPALLPYQKVPRPKWPLP